MSTKLCIRCNTEKELSLFTENKRTPDGLMVCCRHCKNEQRNNNPKRKLNIVYKLCQRCRKTKNTVYFTRDKLAKDGLFGYCKDCRKLHGKEYRERIKKEKSAVVSIQAPPL